MKSTVYIDTSVVGGIFDDEFQFWTKLFFDSVNNGNFKLVISELLIQELKSAPKRIKSFLETIPEDYKFYVELTEESEN